MGGGQVDGFAIWEHCFSNYNLLDVLELGIQTYVWESVNGPTKASCCS